MSDSRGGSNEPSMEEILASIRRIIAEDAEQEEKGERRREETSAASETESGEAEEHWSEDQEASRAEPLHPVSSPTWESEGEDEILELTQLVNEDGSITDLSERGGSAAPFVVVGEESSSQGELRDDPEEPEAEVIEESSSVVQTHDEQSPAEKVVVTETVEEAVVETEAPAAASDTEAQVDSEVRAWLDRNLPEIVERVVREEVERMLRRLKDD